RCQHAVLGEQHAEGHEAVGQRRDQREKADVKNDAECAQKTSHDPSPRSGYRGSKLRTESPLFGCNRIVARAFGLAKAGGGLLQKSQATPRPIKKGARCASPSISPAAPATRLRGCSSGSCRDSGPPATVPRDGGPPLQSRPFHTRAQRAGSSRTPPVRCGADSTRQSRSAAARTPRRSHSPCPS